MEVIELLDFIIEVLRRQGCRFTRITVVENAPTEWVEKIEGGRRYPSFNEQGC